MKEFKGTKGKWEYLGLSVFCNEADKHICKVYCDGTNEIDEANAKLIAAAPELLKALQDIIEAQYDPKCTLASLNGFIKDSIKVVDKALN